MVLQEGGNEIRENIWESKWAYLGVQNRIIAYLMMFYFLLLFVPAYQGARQPLSEWHIFFCSTKFLSIVLLLEGSSFQQQSIFLCVELAGTCCKCRGIQIAFPLLLLMQCVSCFLSVKEFYMKPLQKSYEEYLNTISPNTSEFWVFQQQALTWCSHCYWMSSVRQPAAAPCRALRRGCAELWQQVMNQFLTPEHNNNKLVTERRKVRCVGVGGPSSCSGLSKLT